MPDAGVLPSPNTSVAAIYIGLVLVGLRVYGPGGMTIGFLVMLASLALAVACVLEPTTSEFTTAMNIVSFWGRTAMMVFGQVVAAVNPPPGVFPGEG
jgi:hypothetical protein